MRGPSRHLLALAASLLLAGVACNDSRSPMPTPTPTPAPPLTPTPTPEPQVIHETARLTASDGAAHDLFGWALSVSGDIALVGAPSEGPRELPGAAYVFYRDQDGRDAWGEVKKVVAPYLTGPADFGWSVSVSGELAVIGSPSDGTAHWLAGSAHIFQRHRGGTDNWGRVTKLVAADAEGYDYFGRSVSISGDLAVVGAPLESSTAERSGSAYVFLRHQGGQDNWGQVAKLVAPDGATDDRFGAAVAVSGDTVVIGAESDDDGAPSSGSAYIFERDAGGQDNWGLVTKIVASIPRARGAFGSSVSISGDVVAVNGTYVFYRDEGGPDRWGEVVQVPRAGSNVSVSGPALATGAWVLDSQVIDPASVFFRNQGRPDSWGQTAQLIATDDDEGDQFGWIVAISGDVVLASAARDDVLGEDSGSAYVFTLDGD